jgi:hypothetical protein
MKRFLPVSLLLFVSLLIVSCSSSIYRDVYPTLVDGRYDSEFPYRGCSEQLEEIISTVKRINVMSHYRTYLFSPEDSVVADNIQALDTLLRHREPLYEHSTFGGTGTIIFSDEWRISLITCAHIVDFPDTMINHYVSPDNLPTRYARSISFKTGESIFLGEVSASASFDILAIDRSVDLAIIGHKHALPETPRFKAFSYRLGKARELEWGSFVYVFGYPAGLRMISKGIVSPSGRLPAGSFNVDAVISGGSSGSLALAVRDGVPHFELVGILKAVPAQSLNMLVPTNHDEEVQFDPSRPYHGDVYVARRTEILPGIAQAIPVESLIQFISDNQKALMKEGYDLSSWINPPRKEPSPQ